MKNLIIYTDGAYSSARNQGGVGIVFIVEDEVKLTFSKMYKETTNNRMELSAIILALKSIKGKFDKITIITDSQYCLGCILKGWKRKKNILLWDKFDKVYKAALELNSNIEFLWVKGHENSVYNNLADELATNASKEICITT